MTIFQKLTGSESTTANGESVWTGYLLNEAARRIRTATADALEPLGLTPPLIRVLEAIAACPEQTQARLGMRVRMDRTTIVHVIDRLETLGAAERTADPLDRRSYLIALTPPGRALLARAQVLGRMVEDGFLAPLSAMERAAFNALLARLQQPRSCPEENAT